MGTIWIDPTHARFAAANSTPAELQGLVMHELIHNTLGLYDDQIQERLGLKVQKDSSNITQALTATCVNGAGNF
jgi:hypothetical protein